MNKSLSYHIKVTYLQKVSETTGAVVLDMMVPGLNKRMILRVPKKLCREWSDNTVYIWGKFFNSDLSKQVVQPTNRTTVGGNLGDAVLNMPQKHVNPFTWSTVESNMNAYTEYWRWCKDLESLGLGEGM